MVVEFLGAVAVFDVAIAMGAKSARTIFEVGEGGVVPFGFSVEEEGLEAVADDFIVGGEAAEVDEGGVEVDEADDGVGFTTIFFALHAGREADDEGG